MHVLLVNDDGIDADGLAALETAVSAFAEVTVVAPRDAHSGGGHRVSISRPLHVEQLGPARYHVDGTPADCARLALTQLVPHVDWVLSGINHGGNLGVDVYMSGTVAAVREAAWLGKPGIAISQFRKKREISDWSAAAQMAGVAIRTLWQRDHSPGTFWNVNLPDLDGACHVPPLVDCETESQHLHVEYQQDEQGRYQYCGSYQDRLRSPGSDVDVCFSGRIAVTALR